MAVPAYSRWLAAGKPLSPAQPIAELVGRLKSTFPRAAGTFGWWADDSHYQAVPAQDHTPYSQTGWPIANPEWWVFATDVMHRPDLGVDCGVLFGYWLAEAKAGRMPWVKYLIWQATLYDVRNGWAPQANSGHYDHIHISARTDHRTTGLGAWSITPTTGDDMTPDQAAELHNLAEQVKWNTTPWAGAALNTAQRIEAQVTALRSVVDTLAVAITNGGGSVDTAAILAGVDERLAALDARQTTELRDAVADLGEGGAAQVRADA